MVKPSTLRKLARLWAVYVAFLAVLWGGIALTLPATPGRPAGLVALLEIFAFGAVFPPLFTYVYLRVGFWLFPGKGAGPQA